MNFQPQGSSLSGLHLQPAQPAMQPNQCVVGGMPAPLNSQLLVQSQTSQQPVLIKSQAITPSKPLIAGKSSSAMLADCTPLHQVGRAEINGDIGELKKPRLRHQGQFTNLAILKSHILCLSMSVLS